MADKINYRFFELIPPGTKYPFIRTRWRWLTVSLLLLVLSVASMAYNYATRGAVLNFGIDFAGGSQVRLALSHDADVSIQSIREALEQLRYEGASVVQVPDAENQVMVRVKEVASVDTETVVSCEQAVRELPGARLTRFSYPDGGNKLFLNFDGQPVYREIERALTSAGCVGKADKGMGKPEEYPVEISLIGLGARLQEQLDERFGANTVDHIVSSESVGAKVGNQLKIDGVVSMLYAIGFIFLYVMVRFDLRFAPGGILALAHDALITVGAFAITWKEFNLQTVAAILTIIGYSINDTIVVYDRVRERVALYREADIEDTTNTALNETLSRTILTSGTTLLVVIATYVLGIGTIKDFAFALMVGFIVGTYSSVFIASPVFLWVNRKFYGGKGHLRWLEAKDVESSVGPVLAPADSEVDEHSGRPMAELRLGPQEERAEAGDAVTLGPNEPTSGEPKASRRRRRQRPT